MATPAFLRPVASGHPEPWGLYAAMLAIWHLRPALQRKFPLHRGRLRDQIGFLAWCATDGRREYRILREIPAWDEQLRGAVDLPRLRGDRWEGSHSMMNFLHGVALHRWQLGNMMASSASRHRAARHFWRGARHRNHAPSVAAWQSSALHQAFGSTAVLARTISMKKHAAAADVELISEYGLEDLLAPPPAAHRPDPPRTILPQAVSRSRLRLPPPALHLLEPALRLFQRGPKQAESARVMRQIDTSPRTSAGQQDPFGVNLIGFARGELGIGEDIRQVALALEAAGIPVCILDFAPGQNISQAEESATRFLADRPRYGINLFCLTGIETTRFVCERGIATLVGRYNIGLWPWELTDWPESCRHAYACVDEIWGISEHAARAHRHAAPRPVLTMGLPVQLGPVGPETRRDFGLPEADYLYYFAFDINSSAARKNPEGLIAAFQRAFPRGTPENVGLVLKISHPETGCQLWRRIRRAARRDPRIHLIEKTLRRPQLLALFQACDCFVSLHRAEGFGRGLAEALLLGKQVVATGYSGNLDFCREPRVALVRHRMIPLKNGDYMWGEGQSWADPDPVHAAELMRSVRATPLPLDGASFAFCPAATGRRYADRLRAIWRDRHSTATIPS